MIPFIPNDKYDIDSLEKCWKYVRVNMTSVEITYFSKLAAKTYDLFLEYIPREDLPKILIRVLCILGQFELTGEHEKYSVSDVIKEVVAKLLSTIICGYYCRYDETEPFVIMYHNEPYTLDTKTFDISPIIKKQN